MIPSRTLVRPSRSRAIPSQNEPERQMQEQIRVVTQKVLINIIPAILLLLPQAAPQQMLLD